MLYFTCMDDKQRFAVEPLWFFVNFIIICCNSKYIILPFIYGKCDFVVFSLKQHRAFMFAYRAVQYQVLKNGEYWGLGDFDI